MRAERRRLAGDLAEIDLLTSYLAWDPAAAPDAVRTLRALRGRMLMLLPVLSSLADRVRARPRSRDAGAAAIPARLRRAMGRAAPTRIRRRRCGPASSERRRTIRAARLGRPAADQPARAAARAAGPGRGLPAAGRPRQAGRPLPGRARLPPHRGTGRSAAPRPWPRALVRLLGRTRGLSRLRVLDRHRAGPDGAVAAEMAAVACCFFAALDDPVPAIMQFLDLVRRRRRGRRRAALRRPARRRRLPDARPGAGPALPAVRHAHRHAADRLDRHGADRERRDAAQPAKHLRRPVRQLRQLRHRLRRRHGRGRDRHPDRPLGRRRVERLAACCGRAGSTWPSPPNGADRATGRCSPG